MEDYEQKYKEALENFKKIKAANKDNKSLVDFIEYEYPELIENEDERIRKALIRDIDIAMPIETAQRYIAWLKKQGEQKPAWSEEDDEMFDKVIQTEISCIDNCDADDVGTTARFCYEKEIRWLKTIKHRMKGNKP